jgi:thioredoxin reductase (NADPH)
MVIRESELRESVKYWAKPDIENRIKEGSIKAFFNAELLEIMAESVRIKTPEGEQTLPNDFVLAMTGYQPPFAFMEAASVQFQQDEYRTPIYNELTMETSTPGLYLAGVVCGGLKTNKWFIENSRVHAEVIVQHLVKKLQTEQV